MNNLQTYDMDSICPIFSAEGWQQRSFHFVIEEGFAFYGEEIELIEIYLN